MHIFLKQNLKVVASETILFFNKIEHLIFNCNF